MSIEKLIPFEVIGRPPELTDAKMVYDSTRNVIVLFGGETVGGGGATQNETWELDLDVGIWTQKFPQNSPPARTKFGMVYDSARGKVVLFGGFLEVTFDVLNDTWEYDGTDWTQNTTVVPVELDGRAQGAMVYDADRARTVWFGGLDLAFVDTNKTFEYDGNAWFLVTPTALPPDGRQDSQMAFDPVRKKVVLFGGFEFPGSALKDETWEYDGITWLQITTALTPSVRVRGVMAWHGGLQALVLLYGAISGLGGGTSDVWIYDGSWSQLFPSDTAATDRRLPAVAGDTKRGTVIMFGGETIPIIGIAFDETWEFARDSEWDLLQIGFDLEDTVKLEVLNGGRYQPSTFPSAADSQSIIAPPFFALALASFDVTIVLNGAGNGIKFAIELDGSLQWFSSGAWVDSDGSVSQTNLASELDATAMAALSLLAVGSKIRILSLLDTAGVDSPELEEIRISYSPAANDSAFSEAPILCNVFGTIEDARPGTVVRAIYPTPGFFHGESFIPAGQIFRTILASDSTFSLVIPETATAGKTVTIEYVIISRGLLQRQTFASKTIPNQASIEITDL